MENWMPGESRTRRELEKKQSRKFEVGAQTTEKLPRLPLSLF